MRQLVDQVERHPAVVPETHLLQKLLRDGGHRSDRELLVAAAVPLFAQVV